MLIAQRVKSLIEATPVRVKSSDGSWQTVQPVDKVKPGEIMILMPNRVALRDVITRHLQDLGIPAQVDREGGLLERPAANALEGLLQFVARPKSRHNASWVARSAILGLSDSQ